MALEKAGEPEETHGNQSTKVRGIVSYFRMLLFSWKLLVKTNLTIKN